LTFAQRFSLGLLRTTPFMTPTSEPHSFPPCTSCINTAGARLYQEEFENLTVEIADNLLGRYPRYAKMLKDGEADPEVKFISWYLRNHTRRIDKQYYAVTYRELQTILHRYGFGLYNPRGNHIDIVKVRQRPRFLGILGKAEIVEERIGQIGFPRWTSEVGRSAIKTVREITGLTHERGVDSAAFFQGLDPIQTLITTYHEPLMSLAGR
jgi:hypothetical protein